MELSLHMLELLLVCVGFKVCHCNKALIVFMDNNEQGVGGDANFQAKLLKPEKLEQKVYQGTVLSFTR